MTPIEKLKKWRADGLKVYEIARKVGTTERQISRWLSGKHKMRAAWERIIKKIR